MSPIVNDVPLCILCIKLWKGMTSPFLDMFSMNGLKDRYNFLIDYMTKVECNKVTLLVSNRSGGVVLTSERLGNLTLIHHQSSSLNPCPSGVAGGIRWTHDACDERIQP